MARNHGDCAELPHGASVAQEHAVQQAPADIGQRDAPKRLPAGGAERQGGLFIVLALRLHDRNEFAGDERKRDENGGEHDARHGEYDPHMMHPQIAAEPPVRAEQEDEHESGDDRRHRERQVDESDQGALAAKFEFGDGPGGRDPEHEVAGNRDGRHLEREPDRFPSHRVGNGDDVCTGTLGQRLGEHHEQRHHQKQAEEQQRHGDQQQTARPGAAPVRERFSGRHVATLPSAARR